MICPKCGADSAEDQQQCFRCGAQLNLDKPNSRPTAIGLPQNLAAVLCYVFGWISGIIFMIVEKENKFVRFHAMQSILTFGGLTWLFSLAFAISLLLIDVPNLGPIVWLFWVVGWLWVLLVVILWIVLMIKAYQGNHFQLIWVGNFAEKFV